MNETDESDKTAIAIAVLGALGAAFSHVADAGALSTIVFLQATIAGITYYIAHESRGT